MVDPCQNPLPLSAATMAAAAGFTFEPAPSVIVVFDESLVPSKAVGRKHRRQSHPFRVVGSLEDQVDIVAAIGPGAPVAAITVEFLAALGVRQVVAVGTAGSLDPAPGPSMRGVVSGAVSDEGTSHHYHHDLSADPALVEVLAEALMAPTLVALTTDAPFRHTPARLDQHRERADMVEMECAAIFAAAQAFDLRAAAVLVESDRFTSRGWVRTKPEQTRARLVDTIRDAAHVLGATR